MILLPDTGIKRGRWPLGGKISCARDCPEFGACAGSRGHGSGVQARSLGGDVNCGVCSTKITGEKEMERCLFKEKMVRGRQVFESREDAEPSAEAERHGRGPTRGELQSGSAVQTSVCGVRKRPLDPGAEDLEGLQERGGAGAMRGDRSDWTARTRRR